MALENCRIARVISRADHSAKRKSTKCSAGVYVLWKLIHIHEVLAVHEKPTFALFAY